MLWSTDMLMMLTDRWEHGDSISVIGRKISAEFDVNISRNAVASMARRQGLEARGLPVNIRDARNGTKPKRNRLAKPAQVPSAPPPWVAPAIHPAPVVKPAPVLSLIDPNDTGCKYLMGDVAPKQKVKVFRGPGPLGKYKAPPPNRTYGQIYDSWEQVPVCGNPRKPGSSYCPHHHKACHKREADTPSEPAQPFVCKTPKWRGFAA